MPKHTKQAESRRSGPYNLRVSTSAPTTTSMALASPMPPWTPHHSSHNMSWSDPHLQYQQPQMMQTYMPQIHTPHLPPTTSVHRHVQAPPSTQVGQPGQSSPWTDMEDQLLMDAKSKGLPWNEIHQRFFPTKTGNACRKRHERLMIKLRTTDWDDARVRRLVDQYNKPGFREAFWGYFASRVDERWDDVERVCFQQGLKGLRSSRTRHTRNQSRASSGQGALSEYGGPASHGEYDHHDHDDSVIGLGVRSHSRRSSHAGPALGHILQRRDSGYGYS